MKDLKGMLKKRKDALNKWDEDAKKEFKTWFGTTDEKTKKVIINRIEKMEKLLDGYTVKNFKAASPSKKGRFAYVYPKDDSLVYLDDAFSGAPATGRDSKMGTLAHEMAHFNSIGGTDDHVYGEDSAKKWLKMILMMLWIIPITLNISLKAKTLKKDKEMSHLIVENIDIQTVGKNTLVELTLCNTRDNKYFLEKRFVFKPNDTVLTGFRVTRNGKKIPYIGMREKMPPSKFPEDYIEIKPGESVTSSILLNQFFDLKQGQEYLVSYKIRNANPISHEADVIEYKNKMIQIGK